MQRFVLSLCLIIISASATNYYVSSSGNDANPGTSSTAQGAWKTVAAVNSRSFIAGDSVLFEGGSAFAGQLQLGNDDNGSSTRRLVLASYGSGRAVISGGNASAIVINGSDYLTLRAIIAAGAGISPGQQSGAAGVSASSTTFLSIDSVEAYGFRGAGINLNGCPDSRITRVYAHGNGHAGINGRGNLQRIYVGYCTTNDNPGDPNGGDISGSGIELYNANDGLIEFCEAARNGGQQNPNLGNGPCGIWVAYTRRCTIQYCISHDNKSPAGDGGGFDIDSECRDVLLQHCYAYNNCGYGVQFWQWSGSTQAMVNVTVRYCVFDRNFNGAHIGHNNDAPGGAINHCELYNNVFVTRGGVDVISIADVGGIVDYLRFRNNIFITDNGGNFFFGGQLVDSIVFQGNCYWSMDGQFKMYGYTSLSAWANATGQEKVNGALAGMNADPQVTMVPDSLRIADPERLAYLGAYMLMETSPCINKGLNLQSLFGINPGTRDLFGNPVPAGLAFDIGAYEYPGPFKPICRITSPLDGQCFAPAPSSVVLTANAWHPQNTAIASVAFFQGDTKICEDNSGNDGWTCTWSNAAAGGYILTARVTDTQGNSTTSPPVRIVVGYREPENPSNPRCGTVDYAYYEGTWTALPKFDSLTSSETGTCPGFDLSVRNRLENFGIRFSGYLDVPADGTYTFYLTSNDGSRLVIGNSVVADNDGVHGSTVVKSGSAALKAGKHALTLDYFQATSTLFIGVSWECVPTGVAKQSLPVARLCTGNGSLMSTRKPAKMPFVADLQIRAAPGRPFLLYCTIPQSQTGVSTIRIVDNHGRTVKTPVHGWISPGYHAFSFDGNAMPAGRYLCTMEIGRYRKTVSIVVVR